MPRALSKRLPHHLRHSVVAGHPGHSWLYNSMGGRLYWPQIMNGEYNKARRCAICAYTGSLQRKKRKMKLLPANSPLELVAISWLEPFYNALKSTQFLVSITNRFTMPVPAITTKKQPQRMCQTFYLRRDLYRIASRHASWRTTMVKSLGNWSRFYTLSVMLSTSRPYHPQTNW